MISNYLLSFNSESEQYRGSDSLIKFLDEKCQDWRVLITTQEEFIEFFRTDVHVYQNSWLKKLADEVFNLVTDKTLVELVWKDSTMNEWYRYAAIRELISLAPDVYLPKYIAELISGGFKLGGWGFTMTSELYDFPNSVKVVLESNKYVGNNFEFLAVKACEYWKEYPQELKYKILKERNYFMLKNGDQAMWNMMTLEEKLYLTNVIVANEYAKFHDVITFTNFLNDRDELKVFLFTFEFNHQIESIVRNGKRERFHNDCSFDCPVYSEATQQYIPSEQISRFLAFAQTDTNDIVYNLLSRTVNCLSDSKYRG